MKSDRTLCSLLLATALLCGTANPALAAEAPDPETGEQAGTESPSAPDQADADPSSEVFIPTEEISEDFAVSFPVDI